MLARIRRLALARSAVGGPRQLVWLRVATYAGIAAFVRKRLGRSPQVLTVERLAPGQSMTVQAIAPLTRRQRRRARRD